MNTGLERRYDIDWLRFLTICTVFLFHCARFFDYGGWHVKNAQTDLGVTIFTSALAQWIMPAFFILSGMATYYGLGAKQGRGLFLWERFKRLMIPFIFAIFTMIPFQVYFERVNHSQFTGSFFEFFPHYFDGLYAFGGNFAWMGLHLWYLLFLFLFTLLTLPLFVFLKKPGGQKLIAALADILTRPGVILLLFLFPAILDFGLMPDSPWGIRDMGGWNLFTYLLIYIYGYIFAGDIRFKDAIQRLRWTAFAFGMATYAILCYWMISGAPQTGYNSGYMIFTALRCLNSWSLVLALLGFGSKHLTFNNNILKYATQLILPFYILHQTVIVTIGFYVVQWNAGIALKYLVISTSSLIVVMLLYELLIKRFNLLRFLFGLKTKKTPVTF
jgi:hypothetical protein